MTMIGGPICSNAVPATLIDVEDRVLTRVDKEILWDIFVEIGRCWENLPNDSAGVKSSWLEFMQAKAVDQPSYIGEYDNAIAVVKELTALYGREKAFTLLFLRNGIPDGPPTTRLLLQALRLTSHQSADCRQQLQGSTSRRLQHSSYVRVAYTQLPRVASASPLRRRDERRSRALINTFLSVQGVAGATVCGSWNTTPTSILMLSMLPVGAGRRWVGTRDLRPGHAICYDVDGEDQNGGRYQLGFVARGSDTTAIRRCIAWCLRWPRFPPAQLRRRRAGWPIS